jgi:hypothetical protein
MQFLRGTTLESVDGQTVTVVIRSNLDTVQTISARAFQKNGTLLLDCVPARPGKYIVTVPGDAIISSADRTDRNWKYGIFIHPQSEAAQFIERLIATKAISNN